VRWIQQISLPPVKGVVLQISVVVGLEGVKVREEESVLGLCSPLWTFALAVVLEGHPGLWQELRSRDSRIAFEMQRPEVVEGVGVLSCHSN